MDICWPGIDRFALGIGRTHNLAAGYPRRLSTAGAGRNGYLAALIELISAVTASFDDMSELKCWVTTSKIAR